MQNENEALKRAITEGMTAILAAIDNIGADTPTPKAEAITPKKKKRKKKHGCYRVEDLRALYRLADAGLLHCIKGTSKSVDYPGSYAYLVDKNAETKAVLAVFLTQEEIAEDV